MSEIPRFDVFISYAHYDLTWAESFHRVLKRKGFVSSFEDFNSSSRNTRDELFDAVYSSAVCLLVIGSPKTSPWWDDHIGEAIGQRVSNSRSELRVVSVLCSSQELSDRSDYQSILPFGSDGMFFTPDCMDETERLHKLILLIRGADRRPSLADSALCKLARVRAKKALEINWSKRRFSFPLQTEPQLIRFRDSLTQKYFDTESSDCSHFEFTFLSREKRPEQKGLFLESEPAYGSSIGWESNIRTAQPNHLCDIYTKLRRTLTELNRMVTGLSHTPTSEALLFDAKLAHAPVIENPGQESLPVNKGQAQTSVPAPYVHSSTDGFEQCNRGRLFVPLHSSSLLAEPTITQPGHAIENEVKIYLVMFGTNLYMACQFPNIDEVGARWTDEPWMHKLWVRTIDNMLDRESKQSTQPDFLGLIDDSLATSKQMSIDTNLSLLATGQREGSSNRTQVLNFCTKISDCTYKLYVFRYRDMRIESHWHQVPESTTIDQALSQWWIEPAGGVEESGQHY